MSWTPLGERFTALPLILSGPLLRRVEPQSVTVWLALKEPRMVTLRVYARNDLGGLVQQFEGTHHTIRLGNHLHIVAVTARATANTLHWGGLYYYDLFFQADDHTDTLDMPVPENVAHLETPGILNINPSQADPLHRLVYPGHALPSFVLPAEDVNQLRVIHGSCRKPHGVGREMLSALDSILELAIQQGKDRPQQLFLTGDQIYADDVAGPLLFALIDAGNFFFAGNEEEVLPVVHVPAHDLPPGERSDIVRNKAMFTTTTPQSQLLALSEYAAMYLFAWSDVPWPTDLPSAQEIWNAYPQTRPEADDQEKVEAEYAAQLEQLEGFRSTLPHVRRALANIATYTICDDHEVTDDWFLDGAWCQRVLASPLGRRIVRNGLLAYALFQAWGNTPQQFAEQSGTALLNAVDAWRGDASDGRVETIEELIGLPTAFSGSGELPRSPRALHWHHTYEGPRYQVILMDTRTRRIYHSPHDFPGLLSRDAMHMQIAVAAYQDAEVTIIISATPVLGVEFIESIQVWSHWFVKENYAYDCEAWALEWDTFQHFLKTVSLMKRVVFLSGDVHYAFGSSMEYWDQHTYNTAKLVNYTSSPFCNEGAGAHIAVLAIGYPRLLHLLRRQGTPTMDFFAWDIAPGDQHVLKQILSLIRQRIHLFWWAIPRLLAARRSPYEIVMPVHGWLKGAFHGCPPDRVYRLRYLSNTLARKHVRKRDRLHLRMSAWLLRFLRLALGEVILIETGVRRISRSLLWKARKGGQASSLPARTLAHGAAQGTHLIERQLAKPRNKLVAALLHSTGWLNHRKAGELFVCYNNLGEIHFNWSAEKKVVMQRLWYYTDDPAQLLLKADYHDALEPPAPNAAPPLP
jgi:hypothetical protein